ncbi:hypothetical protein [Streptomyces sp. NPDC005780]|uniref:hypothetical protein n=1 Tax=Streptomyces sp. NPDC005780 TaxID=3364730 RepID=UPI0036BE5633
MPTASWQRKGAFLGSLFGFMVRRGVLNARHAKTGAPLGPWTVNVDESNDVVCFTGTHMEMRRGRRSLDGYVETAGGSDVRPGTEVR